MRGFAFVANIAPLKVKVLRQLACEAITGTSLGDADHQHEQQTRQYLSGDCRETVDDDKHRANATLTQSKEIAFLSCENNVTRRRERTESIELALVVLIPS